MDKSIRISTALIDNLRAVTGKWCKQRRAEERHEAARLNRRYAMERSCRFTLKEAAYDVLPAAYAKASSNGTLPAHARQIYYAARTLIQELTDERLSDVYFTQVLLPDYIREHGVDWNVVYDARGVLKEPHTGPGWRDVPLGTLGVRNYLSRISSHQVPAPDFGIVGGRRYPTCGPRNRYSAVLFLEKEGFHPLLEAAQIADKYDLAIMSTKGMSNIAARTLVDSLGDVKIFVLHDFDLAGFGIFGTLRGNTRRHTHTKCMDNIIDLGLRLKDVQECGLEPELAAGRMSKAKLREYGATDEEIEFLQSERVELNAFASQDFVDWLEKKLRQHGVKKVIPGRATLEAAFRRATEVIHVEEAVAEAVEEARRIEGTAVPRALVRQIKERIKTNPTLAWDDAVYVLASENYTAMSEEDGDL